jgi:hypothetical protein
MPLLTGERSAYLDRNATRSARDATREERLARERPVPERNIDPLSEEGIDARLRLEAERKRRGLSPSTTTDRDADNAARIAEGEEDEIETYIRQRMTSYQEPAVDRWGNPLPGAAKNLDAEAAHERAIGDALELFNRVPKRWVEQAASDPAYAAHLQEHGVDPKTGRRLIPRGAVTVGPARLP